MKVAFVPDPHHREIFEDDDFKRVVEYATNSKEMLHFIGRAIRDYRDAKDLRHGRGGPNLEALARTFLKDRRSRKNGAVVVRLLERLYDKCNPDHVRGCLIESMVEQRLQGRYGEIENNVFVKIDSGVEYQTSTSVDVAGYDGVRGECHDCKTRSRSVKPDWIDELVTNLGPHQFLIGVVTADSEQLALRELREKGLNALRAIKITGPESWWDGLPLRQT